jgi:hypothetical protein
MTALKTVQRIGYIDMSMRDLFNILTGYFLLMKGVRGNRAEKVGLGL